MADGNDDRTALLAAARHVAAQTGVTEAVLLAVAIAETNATAFARFDGRREPLIRFEGHCFDRRLSPVDRATARAAGLAAAKAGIVRNPPSQAARWRLLDRAAAIDADAAYAAVSWGLGQVMGAHASALGYDTPRALAAEARSSIEGQVRIMAQFLRIGDLHRRLDEGDVAGFARLYNGPAYRRNGYDRKIAKAHAQALRWLDAAKAEADGTPAAASPPPKTTPPERPSPSASPPASVAAPPDAAMPAKGWSDGGGSLSAVLSWLITRFSTRAPTRSVSTRASTRSSSISTERSSASKTTPPPSASNPRS